MCFVLVMVIISYIILYILILYYYIIIHILLYYYTYTIILLYIILYYTLPLLFFLPSSFSSSNPSSSLPNILYLPNIPHSFYPCRVLHMLIYIPLPSISSSDPNIHSILVGTWIRLFMFFCLYSSDLSFPSQSLPSFSDLISILTLPLPPSSSSPPTFLLHSILVGTWIGLFIFSSSSSTQFWPRTKYRSGWLRCDVVMSMCSGLSWCYIVLLYSILILYYILLIYLSQSSLLFLPTFSFSSSSFSSSSVLLSPTNLSSVPPSHSFYTCRYLHILIYVPGQSDPACFIGVDG